MAEPFVFSSSPTMNYKANTLPIALDRPVIDVTDRLWQRSTLCSSIKSASVVGFLCSRTAARFGGPKDAHCIPAGQSGSRQTIAWRNK